VIDAPTDAIVDPDILTSFIEPCKRVQINPFTYLRHIFDRVSAHSMNHLEQLLLNNWQTAQTATQNLPG
jgi:hypothetical protein